MKPYFERISTLDDVNACFDQVRTFYHNAKYYFDELNCHLKELYDIMLSNVESCSPYQFTAKIEDVVIGHIVASVENDQLTINSIVVNPRFQKRGIARKMIKIISNLAKVDKIKVIKILERERANGFFARAGFIPFLRVVIIGCENIEKVKSANINRFKIIKEEKIGNDYYIDYDTEEEAVQIDKSFFVKASKNVQATFIYEKKLYKVKEFND